MKAAFLGTVVGVLLSGMWREAVHTAEMQNMIEYYVLFAQKGKLEEQQGALQREHRLLLFVKQMADGQSATRDRYDDFLLRVGLHNGKVQSYNKNLKESDFQEGNVPEGTEVLTPLCELHLEEGQESK